MTPFVFFESFFMFLAASCSSCWAWKGNSGAITLEGRWSESVFLRVRGGEGKRAGVDFIISLRACCGDNL